MGFKPDKTIYTLKFAGKLEGLEVQAKSTSMGESMAIQRLLFQLDDGGVTAHDVDVLDEIFERFARVLISWNLEDEGPDGEDVPVPPTKDGLLSQDPDVALAIIAAWKDAMDGVDPDLGKDSNSGSRFPEVSIPMDALSASPMS